MASPRAWIRALLLHLNGWICRLSAVLPGTSATFGVPRGFSVSTRDWFSQLRNGRHAAPAHHLDWIGDAEAVVRRTPAYIDPPLQAKTSRCLAGTRLPRFVASLSNGRYLGSGFGNVITEDDTFLQDISLNHFNWCREVTERFDHLGFQRLPPPVNLRLPGNCLVLNTPFASNYHHFLLDTLPRIGLCEQAGILAPQCDAIVLDYWGTAYQQEILSLLGIDTRNIIPTSAQLHLKAETLQVPSISEPVCRETTIDYSPDGMEFVRRWIRPGVESGKKRRLLLSRRLAQCHRWLEEEAALADLEKLGFERVECERLSVSDQARLFGEAEAVVMPHGGGMANCVFCEPGTKIFELFHPSYYPVFMLSLSSVLDLQYHAIAGDPDPIEWDSWEQRPPLDVRIAADHLLSILHDYL